MINIKREKYITWLHGRPMCSNTKKFKSYVFIVWLFSVWLFYTKFYVIPKIKSKPNRNQFKPNSFGSVILYEKPKPNQLILVLFSSVLVWFGLVWLFYIKKKTILFFWVFLDFLIGLVSVCSVWFFSGSVWFFSFQAYKTETEPNQIFFLIL
jgi:hypothetical protein